MKWVLVTMAVFGYLLSDRLPLMQHDSEAVANRVGASHSAVRSGGYSTAEVKAHTRLVERAMKDAANRESLKDLFGRE